MSQANPRDPFRSVRGKPNQAVVNVVIQAITDVINAGKGEKSSPPTPTEYLCALIQALKHKDQSVEHIAALSTLLKLSLFHVPSEVLLKTNSVVSQIILEALEQYAKEVSVCRHTIVSVAIVLNNIASNLPSTSIWTQRESIQLAQSLLLFCIDTRPKIRKDAQKGAIQFFISLSKRPDGIPAQISEIMKEFCLREIGECSVSDHQAVLHLTAVLKPVLPLLPAAVSARILEALCALASCGKPLLTLTTFQCLQEFFRSSNTQTSTNSEFLRQLVTGMIELKPHQNNHQSMASYYKMMVSGFVALHKVNAAVCYRLLPVFFTTLPDGLSSNKPAVIANCSKCMCELIESCCDEKLALNANAHAESKQSDKSPLERVVVVVESLLGYRYKHIWRNIFPVFSSTFRSLGRFCPEILLNIVKNLGDLRKTTENEGSSPELLKLLDETLGAAIKYIGPNRVLSVLPLQLPTSDSDLIRHGMSLKEAILHCRSWLLPLLATYVERASLVYFAKQLAHSADLLQKQAVTADKKKLPVVAKTLRSLAEQIWETFPAFCTFPVDLVPAFKWMARTLGEYLRQNKLTRIHICKGMNTLIEQHQTALKQCDHSEHKEETKEERSCEQLTGLNQTEIEERLKVIGSFAKNFLPIFFNILTYADTTTTEHILHVVSLFASIADRKLINDTLFGTVLKKLITTTTKKPDEMDEEGNSDASKAHCYADILLALVEYLNDDNVRLTFQCLAGQLSCPDATLQKKSYNIFASLCKHHETYFANNFREIVSLFVDAQLKCSGAAKKSRLRSMKEIIEHFPTYLDEQQQTLIPNLVMEIMLSVKEVNNKTCEAAYSCLTSLAHKMDQMSDSSVSLLPNSKTNIQSQTGMEEGDAEMEDDTESVQSQSVMSTSELFLILLGGLAGTTPHVQSGAVLCMSRLLYEFKTSVPKETISQVLTTITLLLKSRSREVVKSVLGFVKVATISVPLDILKEYLEDIISGLLLWSEDPKNRFRVKIRVLFERFIRKFGVETIRPLTAGKNDKIIRNLIKEERRRVKMKGTKQRKSFQNEVLSDDYDSNEESFDSRSVRSERSDNFWLKDDDIDLLNNTSSHIVTSKAKKRSKKVGKTDNILEDDSGRIIIKESENTVMSDDDVDSEDEIVGKTNKRKPSADAMEIDDEGNADSEQKEQPNGKSKQSSRPKKIMTKRRKMSKDYSGKKFKGRGAGDVVKASNEHEPFAYVAMNSKFLNRRHKHEAGDQFAGFVAGAKKGAKNARKKSQKKRNKRK